MQCSSMVLFSILTVFGEPEEECVDIKMQWESIISSC